MERIAGWWDGFELWVAGLPFIPQFLVVLVGMVPISFAIAFLLDRALRAIFRALGRDDHAEVPAVAPIAVSAPVAAPVRPTVGSGVR
ncbi:hypothetical protein BOX37_06940 [Nocardia mangyaensis]|uniref:Uncharacterized protein n=1 Tax=Nocardia mangyaensis TaxID=2213200 RepID=A0A1J0VNY0_9NOCA|nr:hypothetical protein [Nocardia mangyaensis]APE33747.1 hypothetical protein BOX37_06940 [Nocardia mangyaensis]